MPVFKKGCIKFMSAEEMPITHRRKANKSLWTGLHEKNQAGVFKSKKRNQKHNSNNLECSPVLQSKFLIFEYNEKYRIDIKL
jgi:hypothetical protein